MPGGWPIGGDVCNTTAQGIVAASSRGTGVLTSATANTKGPWVELVPSTAIDCCVIKITIDATGSGAVGNASFDIAIGASGSETIIVSDLICAQVTGIANFDCVSYLFPLAIPAGTRIAARGQNGTSTSAQTFYLSLQLLDGAFSEQEGYALIDTYGFNSAATQGTTIDSGATIDTKGVYSQLVSATHYDLAGFSLVVDKQNQNGGNQVVNIQWLFDLAVGPSGSEVPLMTNLVAMGAARNGFGTTYISHETTDFIKVSIPAGTRISARAQSTTADSVARLFGLTFYGVRA